MKKLFALASVTGLTGLVAVITAAGCTDDGLEHSSIDTIDSGAGDAKPRETGSSPPEDANNELIGPCKNTKASFTPQPINPPTTQSKTACSDPVIEALADACLQDPSSATDTKCKEARGVVANASCVDCVFGTKADLNWKVINLEEGKSAQYNQAGCIDHLTGVGRCGAAYITLVRCVLTYCPQAPNGTCDDATGTTCFDDVKTTECKPFFLGNNVTDDDQACSSALQSKKTLIDDHCFATSNTAAGQRTFFINMVKTSCESDSIPNDAASDAGDDGG